MPSAWITHVKSVYAAKKKKNPSYKYGQAMKDAKASYKKGSSKSSDSEAAAAPKSAGGKKKQNESGGGSVIAKKVRKQHTAGLANVEEGRLAEKLKPKVKTRQRKRPMLGSAYKNLN